MLGIGKRSDAAREEAATRVLALAQTEVMRIMAEIDARLVAKQDPGLVLGEVTRDLHQLTLTMEL